MSTQTTENVPSPAATDGAVVARRFHLVQLHNPAFWLYAWLVINGAYLYLAGFSEAAVRPSAFVIAIGLQILYCVPLWWFITRRDHFDKEPAKVAVVGFVWGGLVATWMMAAVANPAMLSIYAKLFGVDFATSWGPALTAPFTEESAKFSGVVMLVLLARPYIRSTYDALILGAFVGLGFQVFENVEYIVSGIASNFNQNPVGEAFKVFVARSLTGFYTHAVFTAITGAALGYLLTEKDRSKGHRWMVFVGMYVTAMIAHGMLDAAPEVPAFTVLSGVVGLGGLIYIWRFADRQERNWVRDLMAGEVDAGVVSQPELDVIAGRRKDRKHYLHGIKQSDGKSAAKSAGHLLDAGYELATAIAATGGTDSERARHARAEVQRLRSATA